MPMSTLVPRTSVATRIAVFVLLAALATSVFATGATGASGGAGGSEAAATRCNGRARLCGRSLGSVAFPTSHNSMSSPADGFFGPNQGATVAEQLDQGIRGFQIDAYEGVTRKGRVYTDLSGPFGTQATDLPPVLMKTAGRIRRTLGAPPPGSPTEVYLCHTFCEIGAVRMSRVARDVHHFLVDHPHEVLVFVIEDYVPPDRLAAVFAGAGLGPMLLAVVDGAPLPTLGEMIRSGHRVLVSLENGDGGPTLPNAFAGLVQETPFTFLTGPQLRDPTSCAPNRGVAAAPIFQFNHWVTPPTRGRARAVNHAALRARVQRCMAERGRVPTLVAVDFAERSDVIGVARRLNRGAQPS